MGINGVEHVVVLMLENRSFDHMTGFLREKNQDINGLNGNETVDGARVKRGADYFGAPDPGHSFTDVNEQIFGKENPSPGDRPTMNGFVRNYDRTHRNDPDLVNPQKVMECFAPEQIPVLSRLAEEFVLCDNWFCSAPTATIPNRLFAQAGTAKGELNSIGNVKDPMLRQGFFGKRFDMPAIYDRLTAAHRPWKIYYNDISWSMMLSHVRSRAENVAPFKQFKKDVIRGKLPAFSFIEPAYYNTLFHKASDQHGVHDVREGERLAADIYNTLRSNESVWKKTLFIITYDEHGGYYDHVPPPEAVSPDQIQNKETGFNFDRLGVRVPTLLISPLLQKGVVDHGLYDHTSILKFLEERFDLEPLTKRDERAKSFSKDFVAENPRDDAPTKIDLPAPGPEKSTDPRLYEKGEPSPLAAAGAVFAFGAFRSLISLYARIKKFAR